MELTHLKYFAMVAEELHFGRAARRLHIAQPPLSQQIKRLEGELEIKLFERTSRKVRLTAAGEAFLEETRAILSRAQGARKRMENMARGRSGSLSIGFNTPALQRVLSGALGRYLRLYPDIKLNLAELGTEAQFEALAAGRLDVALLRPFGHDMSHYESRLLFSESYVAAVSRRHRLAGREVVSIADFGRDPLLMFSRRINKPLHDRMLELICNLGAMPINIQEAASKATLLCLIETGLGWSFMPESLAEKCAYEIDFMPIREELPPVEVYALTLPGYKSPVIENFMELLDDMLAEKN